jgi:hypothetical protein
MSDSLEHNVNTPNRRTPVALGPPAMWWVAHAIAGVVLGALPLIWGMVTLGRGQTTLPVPRFSIVLKDGAATLFACAMFVAAAGLFSHAFLTCFDRIKHRAASGAKAACGLALLLFIAALVHRAIA